LAQTTIFIHLKITHLMSLYSDLLYFIHDYD